MRIMLVDPPCQRFMGYYRFYFPLGLTYIAAVLKQMGNEVIIYDTEHDPCCISPTMKDTATMHHKYIDALQNNQHPIWSEYIRILDEFRPQMVGISVLSVKVASAIKIATLTKEYDKNIIVVAGGEHATVRPQDVLRGGHIDHVVCGEGEQGIAHLTNLILGGEGAPQTVCPPLHRRAGYSTVTSH